MLSFAGRKTFFNLDVGGRGGGAGELGEGKKKHGRDGVNAL